MVIRLATGQWLSKHSWQSSRFQSREPHFESSHRKTLFYVNCIEKTTIPKEKEVGNDPNLENVTHVPTQILQFGQFQHKL